MDGMAGARGGPKGSQMFRGWHHRGARIEGPREGGRDALWEQRAKNNPPVPAQVLHLQLFLHNLLWGAGRELLF